MQRELLACDAEEPLEIWRGDPEILDLRQPLLVNLKEKPTLMYKPETVRYGIEDNCYKHY